MARFEQDVLYQFGADRDIEWIGAVESEVYRVDDTCVKVFPETLSYTEETLQKYQRLTNDIADALLGCVIDISTADGVVHLSLDIVRIDEIGQLPSGPYYTVSRFVGGPTLQNTTELHGKDNWVQISSYHGYGTTQIILQKIYDEIQTHASQYSIIAFRQLENLNVKLNDYTLSVTDIMSGVSSLNNFSL
jgi:hypothetical protein